MASPNRKRLLIALKKRQKEEKERQELIRLAEEAAAKKKQEDLENKAKEAEAALLESLKMADVNPEPPKKAGRPPKKDTKAEEPKPEVKVDEQN